MKLTQESEHSQTVQCLAFKSPRLRPPIDIAANMEYALVSRRNYCGNDQMLPLQ